MLQRALVCLSSQAHQRGPKSELNYGPWPQGQQQGLEAGYHGSAAYSQQLVAEGGVADQGMQGLHCVGNGAHLALFEAFCRQNRWLAVQRRVSPIKMQLAAHSVSLEGGIVVLMSHS